MKTYNVYDAGEIITTLDAENLECAQQKVLNANGMDVVEVVPTQTKCTVDQARHLIRDLRAMGYIESLEQEDTIITHLDVVGALE